MDLEEHIKSLREYDISTDKIKIDTIDDKEVIVLFKNSNSEIPMS